MTDKDTEDCKPTVVTVTYNSATDLRTFWREERRDYDWIVVDNGSSDDSIKTARQLGAQVVALGQNVGFSAANNIGASMKPNSPCYVFLNPDVQLANHSVAQLVDTAMRRNALVAPQLTNADGSLQENGRSAPFLLSKIQHFTGTESRSRHLPYLQFALDGELKQVSWVIGAAVAIPARIFVELSGWDERYFVYYEDSDICLRAAKLGHSTYLTGSVTAVHGWARATRSFSYSAWRLEIPSMVKFYVRYPKLLSRAITQRLTAEVIDV